MIAGSVGVDEQLSYTVVGRTVNLAFRLQELASPGAIYVSQSVQQATQNLFRYRYQDAIEIKGFDELVPVFAVENRQEPQAAPRTAADINLPWTGREREMGELDDLLIRLTQGEGGVVLIEGDAGVGKTRLVRQWLVARTPPGVTVWTGAAHMVQVRIGYSLWRNMMQWASPVSTNPGEFAAAGDVASFPGRVTPLPAAIMALVYSQPSQTARPEEAEDSRVQIFQAMRHMLITQSEVAPLVLVIDNWQWVDEISRHLLLSLLSLADRHRILFCILSRPAPGQSGDIARAIEFQALRNRHRIDLSPLGVADIRYILSSLFETGGLSGDVHSVFLSWTQGNPLFLKELILFLAAQGIIEPSGQGWRLAQAYPLSSLRFPPTLRGLTVANLDRLPDELQEVLHFAAVIGSTFSVKLLRAVMSHNRQTDKLDNSVTELVRRGLVERSGLDPDTFIFRHAIVQESIYDRLLSQERQTLHRTIAEEMENLAEGDASASVELIAYHFIEAALPAKAVSDLIQSGQRARGHAASRLAVEHYTMALVALEFAPRHPTERLEVEIGLADAYLQSHQIDQAISHYQNALDMCEDLEKRIELVQTLSHAYAAQNNLAKAWELLEAALELLSVSDVPATSVTRGRVFADCAQIEWRLGNRRRAESGQERQPLSWRVAQNTQAWRPSTRPWAGCTPCSASTVWPTVTTHVPLPTCGLPAVCKVLSLRSAEPAESRRMTPPSRYHYQAG